MSRVTSSLLSRHLLARFLPSTLRGHTDIRVPDWTPYRRHSVKNAEVSSSQSAARRNLVPYMVAGAGVTIGSYAAKAEIVRYVLFMGPSADVLALAKIEINLDEIPEGVNASFKWRGRPLYVRHRTPDDIKMARKVEVASLRDPATDEDRCRYPEWLVVVGVCTHAGCIPISGLGDFGGYYCPCHGAHFDGAGRVRKGPAPTNLVVPEYTILEGNKLVVG